ncbi:MAG: hypothetical protein AB7P18_35210 [Candidatus Binatia bacterium]
MVEQPIKRQAFSKTPLTYVFMVYGITIGRYLGMGVGLTTPEQAGLYVTVSSILFAFLGGVVGYVISVGIDSTVGSPTGRVVSKWIAGIVGFLIYSIVLATVKGSY